MLIYFHSNELSHISAVLMGLIAMLDVVAASHRFTRRALDPALPTPQIPLHHAALDHPAIRLKPLPDGDETELLKANRKPARISAIGDRCPPHLAFG